MYKISKITSYGMKSQQLLGHLTEQVYLLILILPITKITWNGLKLIQRRKLTNGIN